MKLSLQKLALALAFVVGFAGVKPAFAQTYPMPGKSSAAAVKCTNCPGKNSLGQLNAGLPTWPYSNPMINHTGRVVDSTAVTDFQGGTGFATARARLVRVAKTTRGSAPPRVYIQLGSAIAAYTLDRFFSTALPGGMVNITDAVGSRVGRGEYPNEKVLKWDGLIFPEAAESGWQTTYSDGQDKLYDFDIDDRGYVYVATGANFGWGVVRDGGTSMSLLSQLTGTQLMDIPPDHIMSLRTGSRYYVVTASEGGRVIYDVTLPTAIPAGTLKKGLDKGYIAYAKDESRERVAVVTNQKTIEIYDVSSYVAGGSALATFSAPSGRYYRDVTVDENGDFWTSETSKSPTNNKIVKLARGSSTYTAHSYDVYGEAFSPAEGISEGLATINYGDKYLTVMGRHAPGGGYDIDVKIFKIEGGVPVPVDVGGYFAKYYYNAPSGYAQPSSYMKRVTGTYPIKWNNKLYLLFNSQALSDVYELAAGDSINATQKSGTFGTPNPNAKSTSAGPFYGDPMRFTAVSSSSTQYNLTWSFDNPESGSGNTESASTGQDVEHQFTGLDTAAKIETVRRVTATANVNAEVNATLNVTLKKPTARIGVAGTDLVTAADSSALTLVAGDQFSDASDGTIDGHYSSWVYDSTAPVNQTPGNTLPVGDVGPHTVTLAAKYGKYSASSFTTTGSPYVDSVENVTVTVRPFVVSFGNATTSGGGVTFKGSARVTQSSAVLSSPTWTVEWSLKNGAADVVPVQSTSATTGSIPNFVVADRSAIPSGSVLQLKVFVSSGLGTGIPSEYGTHTITQTLITPDPKITMTGCTSTGQACAFTISSKHVPPYPTTDWSVAWTLKQGSALIASQTLPATEQFKPSLNAPGTYTISAIASTNLFTGQAALDPFVVTGPVCGDPPTAGQIQIYTSCDQCDVNQTVKMRPESFGNQYTFQDCEEYNWIFGDGGTATVTTWETTHKYTAKGTYTIKLTVKKGTKVSPQYTWTIKVGADVVIPPPTCTTPANIQVFYAGNKGCSPGSSCKTTEQLTFTASRGGGSLQSCDQTSWDFGNGATSSSINPRYTFSQEGTYNVEVVVSNQNGQSIGTVTVPVIVDNTGTCLAPPTANTMEITYTGQTSGCRAGTGICKANEDIKFRPLPYLGFTIQACDQFDWDFGDGTPHSSAPEPTHKYSGTAEKYIVRLRMYNSSNQTGNIITMDVPFLAVPVKPVPALTFSSFPATATKGNQVTFVASSNISATGWVWTFSDGPADTSQSSAVGTSNTITHVFSGKGTYKVTVKARNSDDVSTAQTSQVDRDIVVDEVPEHRYLIPVVAHAGGQSASVWRTDIQIYTADPSVSPQNPLLLTATYEGVNFPLSMPKSTLILEDILDTLRPGRDTQGTMLISVKTQIAPQIWSRTYNQTAAGTFGQFIPAILLNETGGGSAVGEGMYYLAGLKSDGRYRTNVGLVNPNAQPMTAIVRLYDDMGPIGQPAPHILQPFQLDQFQVTGRSDRPFSAEIEVPAGTWVIGYASLIDGGSGDPIYMSAIRASELGSSDYRESILPGVGHVGDWRSDVTVYNSDSHTVTVDLAYHDAGGSKVGEAKNVPIKAGEFLQYADILKVGVVGSVPDGVGMLRVSVPATVSADHFPMAVARTYNDNGSGKTYGQGISGFASNRANVRSGKAALIPGVRSNDKYYTNIGLTNVSASVVTVVVKALDPNSGSEFSAQTYTLQPNQSIVGPQDLAGRANASLRIEATGGNVWAFASIIDRGTKDPEYVPATPLP